MSESVFDQLHQRIASNAVPATYSAPENVFVSYARDDLPRVQLIAQVLQRHGVTVFWDRDFSTAEEWSHQIRSKIEAATCIIVLWSSRAITSECVLQEAAYARARNVLIPVRLEPCEPPIEFKHLRTEDLSGFTKKESKIQFNRLIARVNDHVYGWAKQSRQSNRTWMVNLLERRTKVEKVSILAHSMGCKALLSALSHVPYAQALVERSCEDLVSAERAAWYHSDERVSARHYASAARNIGQALREMGSTKSTMPHNNDKLEYCLTLEHANALSCSGLGHRHSRRSKKKALSILEILINDKRYADDAIVNFRYGWLLMQLTADNATLMRALSAFQKAAQFDMHQALAMDIDSAWLQSSIALQTGICKYRLAELPSTETHERHAGIDEAIRSFRQAIELASRAKDSELNGELTTLDARGRLIYVLAQRIREGRGQQDDEHEIKALISDLKRSEIWEVVENNMQIVDCVAFGAATIRDWETAIDAAERNLEAFGVLSDIEALKPPNISMKARAEEIRFLARKLLASAAKRRS